MLIYGVELEDGTVVYGRGNAAVLEECDDCGKREPLTKGLVDRWWMEEGRPDIRYCPPCGEKRERVGTRFVRSGNSHFGGCPQCANSDGCVNVGKGHWFYCLEHRVKWFAGSNLFSSWRDETEAEQRARYDEIGLGDFVHVEPHTTSSSARHLALVR